MFAGRITHVFVLVLENRSFDHLLGLATGTGTDATTGASTSVDGPTDQVNLYGRAVYPVTAGAPFVLPVDPPHEFCDIQLQLASVGLTADGGCPYSGTYPPLTLRGFVDNYAAEATAERNAEALADLGAVMSCFTADQVPVLSTLAREFAVCDRWFSALPGPTWPNRFFLHAATSGGLDHSPTGLEMARSQFAGYHFEHGSVFDALDRAGLDWRVYHGDPFPQVSALAVMDLKTMLAHYHRNEDLRDDLQDPHFPAAYVFIEPNYGLLTPPLGDFRCGDSQHPTDDVTRGEALIKQVYEAIRQSPHWESSLLLVTYDEHGGFYDHVPPPPGIPPGDITDPANNEYGFRFDQLGVRVPTVVVSPWIPPNLIDHTEYDHTSLLATLERGYGLPALTARDAAANDLLHLLSAGTPREAPEVLPAPANSGFECLEGPLGQLPAQLTDDTRPVGAALRGFVQTASIVDARLRPELRTHLLAERTRLVDTVGQAREYLVDVATRLRTVGLG